MKRLWILSLVTLILAAGCRRGPQADAFLSDDATVRESAMASIPQLRSSEKESLVPPLITALGDPDARKGQRAGAALAALGPTAVPALTGLLGANDVFLRLTALEVMAQIGEKAQSALPDIVSATQNQHPLVRAQAAYTLGRFHSPSPEARAAVEKLLKDQDSHVRESAQTALSAWGQPTTEHKNT
jgi:HEAT repeat protein